MTTIGRGSTTKIAGACDDGTVRIYDSVTGVLRVSLRPEFPVLEMTGVPDGSLLICTHNRQPFITLWDIQTGGLIHTFVVEEGAQHTTVSLDGRYLACESQYTVDVWETASRMQNPIPLEQVQGNIPCWLAPEELIMVVDWGSVCIQNVVLKGPPVHKIEMLGSVRSAVYSRIFHRLAIVSLSSRGGTSFTILDVKTGTTSTFYAGGKLLSSIVFSETTKQLVCGGEAPGLETLNISTGRRTRFDLPFTVGSVSTLSNGTVVANSRGSGIHLLSLDQEHASPQQPTLPLLAMYPLDKGRIIAIVPATNDRITLLETATMSQVLSIPTQEDLSVAADHTVVYASLENGIAVCFSKGWRINNLTMWEFSHQHPRWTVRADALASVCSISPACTRLVTLGGVDGIHVWDASNGTLVAQRTSCHGLHAVYPTDVTFDSENRFYIHYNTHREPYNIFTRSRTYNPTATRLIVRPAGQRLEGQVLEKRYSLDDGREWVFCGSQRICWVPPGYIGSAPASHCWAGSSLVMLGQDVVLRRLTFLE